MVQIFTKYILLFTVKFFRPLKSATWGGVPSLSPIITPLQFDVVFTDFVKAFNSVIYSRIISKLESLGIGNPLLSWLQSYLSPRMQFVKIHGVTSDSSITPSGVPQGGHFSPLLFVILTNSINSYLSFSKVFLFVDDIKIYSKVTSICDCR
jgi:hypothetical protein